MLIFGSTIDEKRSEPDRQHRQRQTESSLRRVKGAKKTRFTAYDSLVWFCVYSLFNVSPARHGVSIAGACEDVHVVHDDKRFLLQRDDGEVVLIGILVPVGVVPRPYWEHQRQSSIFPASHLGGKRRTDKRPI